MCTTQRDQTFFFVFIKLPKAIHWPDRKRYSAEEAEAEAAKYVDLPVADGIRFGQLWKQRVRGHLYCLEEGIFKLWHHERIVLVGDSAHKVSPRGSFEKFRRRTFTKSVQMTPTMALGGSCTIESVAVIVNELRREILATPSRKPGSATITTLFNRYQRKREKRAKMIYNVTHEATRVQARDGLSRTLHAMFVAPFVSSQTIADKFALLVKGAAKFDFIPVPARPKGTVDFADERSTEPLVAASKPSGQQRSTTSIRARIQLYFFYRPLRYLWRLFVS